MTTHHYTEFGSARRAAIADVLRSYMAGNLGIVDAIDAIELDVFEQPTATPQKAPRGAAAALITTAVATLLVGLDRRDQEAAVGLGEDLVDELERRGILPILERLAEVSDV